MTPATLSTLPTMATGLLRLPLRLIPGAVHTEILSRLCNQLMKGQLLTGRLQELDGKTISLLITDAPSELLLRIQQGKLRRAPGRHWDVRIAGTLNDFWTLATRSEDPDTLFFNRRLSLEGDTGTGLHIKNLLDALEFDWQAHLRAVFGEAQGARLISLVERLRRQFLPRA